MTSELRTGGDVLERACRAAVAERLRGALRIVEEEPMEDAERLEDALRGGLDSLRAWQAGRALRNPAGDNESVDARLDATAVSAFVRSIERTGAGEPVGEFLLIPNGAVDVERPLSGGSFVFTDAHAAAAVSWFEQLGRKLAIDYEHQTFDRFNTRPDGLRPAAGWIGRLAARADGLWAMQVEWTARAADLIRSGEYRYFSPVIFWKDEDYRELAGLGPVALTNDPAMRGVTPLAARRLAEGSSSDDEDGAAEASDAIRDETQALRMELNRVQVESIALQRQLRIQEADAFIERGLRLGKIVDSTSMDWRDDFLRDGVSAEMRLSRAPVLMPPGRVLRVDERGAVITSIDDPDASHPKRLKAEAQDLAAYERAAAAGRVRFFGVTG